VERHTSLASGWPTDETSQRASRLLKAHRAAIARLCGASEMASIQRQIAEARNLHQPAGVSSLQRTAEEHQLALSRSPMARALHIYMG